MPPRVLVVDDEEKIAEMVGGYLQASGYSPALAFDGAQALSSFAEERPDCIVLDINMPGKDGLEVAREIRKSSNVPIIFLSARAEEIDRILGLELGGDDYVTKPFSPRELVSRIKAVLRRAAPESLEAREGARLIASGDIEMDTEKRQVRQRGEPVVLTAAQFDILAFLMRRPGRVFSRAEILEGAAGLEYEGYERTLDVHIKNIRKALGDETATPRYIGTVRGVGYRFIEPGA
jgi:DNA-binding response OmpR family regulator